MSTVVLGPADALTSSLADGLGAVASELDAPLPPAVDGVVVVVGAGPTTTLDAGEAMWRALVALQHAYAAMTQRGGRIVLVVPTIGMGVRPGGWATPPRSKVSGRWRNLLRGNGVQTK